MILREMPIQSRSDGDRTEALYGRISASVAATPASTIDNMETPIVAALTLIPLLTAAVVMAASELVYERQAVGLNVAMQLDLPIALGCSSSFRVDAPDDARCRCRFMPLGFQCFCLGCGRVKTALTPARPRSPAHVHHPGALPVRPSTAPALSRHRAIACSVAELRRPPGRAVPSAMSCFAEPRSAPLPAPGPASRSSSSVRPRFPAHPRGPRVADRGIYPPRRRGLASRAAALTADVAGGVSVIKRRPPAPARPKGEEREKRSGTACGRPCKPLM